MSRMVTGRATTVAAGAPLDAGDNTRALVPSLIPTLPMTFVPAGVAALAEQKVPALHGLSAADLLPVAVQ
jgi:hypothetical protein